MWGGPSPPIIFERLKLPQQIIYRRKENLSESPNHQKYWENILVSRFYEQFSRNRRNLGKCHFLPGGGAPENLGGSGTFS